MIKINKETITRVRLFDFEELKQYRYLHEDVVETSFFGLFKETIAKAGQYENVLSCDKYFNSEDLITNNRIERNKKVYEKPCVVMRTADGKSNTKWFDDYLSAVNFYKELTNENKWLKL